MTLVACGLFACTTQESNSGGSGGAVGGAQTGAGGSPGGSTGTTATDGTTCPPAAAPLITDFAYTPSDAGVAKEVRFGGTGTLTGGEAVWTNSTTSPLTSDVTQGNWHISGTVDNYAGFNLYFDNCSRIDASAYKGIKFKISGSLGGGTLTLGVGTLNDAIAASWFISKNISANATDPGRCLPTSGTNKYDQTTCADPIKVIPVTADATTISLAWADFAGGKPISYVEPKDIISIYWYFTWSTGQSYPVDITLDDISFIQ
jgi:hypothetical protein